MYELNSTAARIWELMHEGCQRADIERRLLEEFEPDGCDVVADVGALLVHLKSEQLTVE
jgi:hypothetical protein